MMRSLESRSCQSLPFMMKVVVRWCFAWFIWVWHDQCWQVFWVLVNPVLITRPANSVTCLELDQELDRATQVPARTTKLGTGSFSNLKNPHQNCTRASISIDKKQKVKLELEVPFKIIELASKDRNQKLLFKSKNRIKTGKLDHSFLWSLFWFAQNWCNTYLQSVVWSFLLNLIWDTTFLTWECS